MKWERNTVSLPVRVLFRKRRIFSPDKWNSWSNAREWDNAERMRWFSHTCDLCALFLTLWSRRFIGAVGQKRITGTKISHRLIRRYACVHIPRSDMVRYSVQAFRCAGYNPCARVHTHTSNGSSLSLSFSAHFFSLTTEIRAQANDSIYSVGFHF